MARIHARIAPKARSPGMARIQARSPGMAVGVVVHRFKMAMGHDTIGAEKKSDLG